MGSGAEVYLVRYQMGNLKSSWKTKVSVPHPQKRPVHGDEGSASTTIARSAHFLTHKTRLIVVYADRGVMCVSVPIPFPLPLTGSFQLLGYEKSVNGMGDNAQGETAVRI